MGMRKYRRFAKATICRHMKKPTDECLIDKRKFNQGCPPKLTERHQGEILREAERLRRTDGHFTIKHVKTSVGIKEMFEMKLYAECSAEQNSDTHIPERILAEVCFRLNSFLPF